MFIDSHLHLLKEYYEDIERVILEAKENNVKYFIISCCDLKDLNECLYLIKKYDCVFLSIGLHPDQAYNYTDLDLEVIENVIKNNKKIVAIGEIGLDYHYGKDNLNEQILLFKKQLKIAQNNNLPVVIHSRDAVNDTINILKEFDLKGVIHCFSGSYEVAVQYLNMGYKLGIGGVITFKNSKLSVVVKNIDISNIILETDSPYLTPDPFRGTPNEPKYIPLIAKKISEVKNMPLDMVSTITTSTTIELFDLEKLL